MADFLPGAPLYAAARPVKAQTAEAFVERMKGLAGNKLRSFAEAVLGVEVRIFAMWPSRSLVAKSRRTMPT